MIYRTEITSLESVALSGITGIKPPAIHTLSQCEKRSIVVSDKTLKYVRSTSRTTDVRRQVSHRISSADLQRIIKRLVHLEMPGP